MTLCPKAAAEAPPAVCCQRDQQESAATRQVTGQPKDCPVSYRCAQCQKRRKREPQGARRPFRLPRFAVAPNFAQQQTQVVGRTFERMHLAHVSLPAPPRSASAPSFTDLRKGSLAPFAAPTIQRSPLVTTHAPSIGAKGLFVSHRLVGPTPALLSPLGDIGTDAAPSQAHQQTMVVIALVH